MNTIFPQRKSVYFLVFLLANIAISYAQVGIGTIDPITQLDVEGALSLREGTALVLTNGSNTNIDLGTTPYSSYRITGPTSAFEIGSIVPETGSDGQIVTFINTTSNNMTIVHTGGGGPLRIYCPGETDLVLTGSYSTASFQYNATLTKWMLINSLGEESEDWTIVGNSNTDEATNFIGTTNDQDVIFKRNSVQSGWLDSSNTGYGYNSLNPSTIVTTSSTGIHNTGLGQTALFANTEGHRNTAIGSGTMTDNTTGYQNTAIGRYTMHFNISGYNNMAIGQEAAKWNSTGHDNAAIGFNSLRHNGTGSYNVAIGRSAIAISTNGDAIDNVGDNNIAIGTNAQLPDRTDSNQMVFGGADGSLLGGVSTKITETIINGIANSGDGAPSADDDDGVQGEIRVAWDTTGTNGYYLFFCYATNSWGRVLLDTSF